MTRVLCVLAFTVALLAAEPRASVLAPAPAARQELVATSLLDQYLAGQFEVVVEALSALEDFDDLLDQLERHGHAWIDAAAGDARARRELAAATMALEAARLGQWKQWKVTQSVPMPGVIYKVTFWKAPPRLLEWGCTILRRHETPTTAERWWQLAANGVSQRGQDDEFLFGDVALPGRYPENVFISPTIALEHLRHVLTRFPDEPRFKLAQGIAWEWLSSDVSGEASSIGRAARPALATGVPPPTVPCFTCGLPGPGPRGVTTREALKAFEVLQKDVDVGGEATMRLGVLALRQNDVDKALTLFRRVELLTRDPWVIYLSRYFSGQAYERRQRSAEAEAAYRGALAAVPRAQSASIALGALLFRDGRRSDGSALVEDMLAATPPPPDPWRGYIDADDRFWPELLTKLRAEIRP